MLEAKSLNMQNSEDQFFEQSSIDKKSEVKLYKKKLLKRAQLVSLRKINDAEGHPLGHPFGATYFSVWFCPVCNVIGMQGCTGYQCSSAHIVQTWNDVDVVPLPALAVTFSAYREKWFTQCLSGRSGRSPRPSLQLKYQYTVQDSRNCINSLS